jgi:hypothetical protein
MPADIGHFALAADLLGPLNRLLVSIVQDTAGRGKSSRDSKTKSVNLTDAFCYLARGIHESRHAQAILESVTRVRQFRTWVIRRGDLGASHQQDEEHLVLIILANVCMFLKFARVGWGEDAAPRYTHSLGPVEPGQPRRVFGFTFDDWRPGLYALLVFRHRRSNNLLLDSPTGNSKQIENYGYWKASLETAEYLLPESAHEQLGENILAGYNLAVLDALRTIPRDAQHHSDGIADSPINVLARRVNSRSMFILRNNPATSLSRMQSLSGGSRHNRFMLKLRKLIPMDQMLIYSTRFCEFLSCLLPLLQPNHSFSCPEVGHDTHRFIQFSYKYLRHDTEATRAGPHNTIHNASHHNRPADDSELLPENLDAIGHLIDGLIVNEVDGNDSELEDDVLPVVDEVDASDYDPESDLDEGCASDVHPAAVTGKPSTCRAKIYEFTVDGKGDLRGWPQPLPVPSFVRKATLEEVQISLQGHLLENPGTDFGRRVDSHPEGERAALEATAIGRLIPDDTGLVSGLCDYAGLNMSFGRGAQIPFTPGPKGTTKSRIIHTRPARSVVFQSRMCIHPFTKYLTPPADTFESRCVQDSSLSADWPGTRGLRH